MKEAVFENPFVGASFQKPNSCFPLKKLVQTSTSLCRELKMVYDSASCHQVPASGAVLPLLPEMTFLEALQVISAEDVLAAFGPHQYYKKNGPVFFLQCHGNFFLSFFTG